MISSFRSYLVECGEGIPLITPSEQSLDLYNVEERDALNGVLDDITTSTDTEPELIYERLREVVMGVGYGLPPVTELSDLFAEDEGEELWALGTSESPLFFYFAFVRNEDHSIEVLGEIVSEGELDDLLTGE